MYFQGRILCSIYAGMILLGVCSGFDSEVLWKNCKTTICGRRPLTIYCEQYTAIMINSVASGRGSDFDRRSYLNLRRMCNGMTVCNPSQSGFCQQHGQTMFNVSYICVRDTDVEKECHTLGKSLNSKKGFIMSPNYPAQTKYRNCKWRIDVPRGYFLHIVLHEVLPISADDCGGGLIFTTDLPCPKKPFPSYAVCDEAEVNTTIASCGNTDIDMTVSNRNSMRFWLSYYVVQADDLSFVSIYDVDITCVAYGKKTIIVDPAYIYRANVTDDAVSSNTTQVLATDINGGGDDDDDYVVYVAVAVVVVVVVVGLILLLVYLRYRYKPKQEVGEMKHSSSQTNDIQKRPLPDRQDTIDSENQGHPVLNEGYSRVADEITHSPIAERIVSPTYAEIEECAEPRKPVKKSVLVNKPSIDSLQRKLPAKPIDSVSPKEKEPPHNSTDSLKRQLPEKPKEIVPPKEKDDPHNSIYYEIEDASPSPALPQPKPMKQKPIFDRLARYQSNIDKNKPNDTKVQLPTRARARKESPYNDIYTECDDVTAKDKGKERDNKAYMDMSSVPYVECEYTTQTKGKKDKDNISRRKEMGPNNVHADYEDIPKESGLKKESVTSESDSDGDIIIENELYEPFESAKV